MSVYVVEMYLIIGVWLMEFQKMLSFETNPDVELELTQRSNSPVETQLGKKKMG